MLIVKANAKINLTLDVLGTREDGFHEVAMIMQTVGLHDTLYLSKTDGEIKLAHRIPYLPRDARNLAWKAAKLMIDRFSLDGGVHIRLEKHIPVAAGLAGGSADAAAVLKGMNILYKLHLSREELCRLGAELGSDIPFCLQGGTMLATGRGECLERLPEMPDCYVVLAKPPFSVSTPWAYAEYDKLQEVHHPDNRAMEQAIAGKDLRQIAGLMGNVLENVTLAKYTELEDYKKIMLEHGALASMMSGSGPTVFCLVENRPTALKIANALRKKTRAHIYVTRTWAGRRSGYHGKK